MGIISLPLDIATHPKKTLFFIMTEGAVPGEPYKMKFTDIHGNPVYDSQT